MNKLILKGTSVSIYRGNMLITSGKLLENLEKVSLTGKKLEILLPIELLKEVKINDQILLSIEHGAELTVKIEMDNQTIVQSLFSKL